jgi:NTE family protein
MRRRTRFGWQRFKKQNLALWSVTIAFMLVPLAAQGDDPLEPSDEASKAAAALADRAESAEPVDTAHRRPVIGLVLSGGGARGLAHVGVIRWLEEHRIPIDLIAGTSMGGLVGGMYATGADSGQMEALIESIDWDVVLSGDTPYEQKAYRRKEDAREAPSTLEIGLRDGIKLPLGLDAGHQVGLVLDRIAFPYSGLDSFDQLPTPFACVAVDLESGDEVVFRSGSFAEALRSTMSFPGWFAPVRSGDRVMVDGGVLNNLPTDVMEKMGADIIIAVDLGMQSSEEQPIDNVLGVLDRTLTVMMRQNTDRNAERADMLITPDVSGYGFTDFDGVDELGRIGYEATAELAGEIAAFGLDESEWNAFQQARADRRKVFEATPQFIEVSGATEVDEPEVEADLEHHIGVELDPDRLDYDLTNITGWGRYNVVGYEGRKTPDAEGLGIDLHETTHGPPFLRPIIDLRGSEFGELQATFGGRVTFFDVAGSNSEWRIDATYGGTTRASTELFLRLGKRGFFVTPYGSIGEEAVFGYDQGESVAEYRVDRAGAGGDVGYLFGPRSQLRFGVNVERQHTKLKVGNPRLPELEGLEGTLVGQWSFDGSNSPIIMTRGIRASVAARWVFSAPDLVGDWISVLPITEDEFVQGRIDLNAARPIGGRFYLFGGASGGTSFNASATWLQQFALGGPTQLGALRAGELRGSNFYIGRVGVHWGLADENEPSMLGKFYLTAFYEIGDAFEKKSDPFQDITFGLTGETILGGVFVGGAIGQEGRGGFFFAIGRLF